MSSVHDVSPQDGWDELQVANPSFLIEKLGSECTDLQGLRELTVNGIEAITALGLGRRGRVVWELDRQRYENKAMRNSRSPTRVWA